MLNTSADLGLRPRRPRVAAISGPVWRRGAQGLCFMLCCGAASAQTRVSSPPFYETWPFYAACALAAVFLGRHVMRLRLRRLEHRNLELRQMQRQLEAKNAEVEAKNVEVEAKSEELQRFTYAVSHDLKSPLITIQGFIGYLERDLASGDSQRIAADIQKIRGAAEKMQALLGELLQLSRIGSVANTLEQIDFGTLAREAVSLVAGQIEASGVDVVIAPDLPQVFGDRSRLLRVLQNLLDNAVKYMGGQSEPRIEIGVSQAVGEETVFWIRDNGAGIDPKYHGKIFGLFEQLDSRNEGTGMGLTMIRRIVEVHGGRIWVESQGIGHGSTFYFTLPSSSLSTTGQVLLPESSA